MAEASHAVEIVNKRGLHARASAKFVAAASALEGCTVLVAKESNKALGTSILGLMMLGAAMGDTIHISVSGEDAEARLAELVALVSGKFGED